MYTKRFGFFLISVVVFICLMSSAGTVVYANETVTLYDNGYRGEGMVIAVIDSEFDVYHEMFALSESTVPKLTEEDIQRIITKEGLNCSQAIIDGGMNPYISEKIPFAFDYSSGTTDTRNYESTHGTHVAGIIGANNVNGLEKGFDGIAPEAQLILMKAAGSDGGFYNDVVALAYDDAIKLGADVVNCSFGGDSGYIYGGLSYMEQIPFELTKNIYNSQIDLSAAAGNAGRTGAKSVYDTLYGIKNPLAEVPDYGMAGIPSIFPHNISVANAHGIDEYKLTLSDENESIFIYTNMNFFDVFNGETVEYAVIPNLGEPADYASKDIDVKGKIAVVERGIITFDEKIEAAHNAGAIGIMIYNNIPGEIDFTAGAEYDGIPYMIIRQDIGFMMAANEADVKTVSFSDIPETTGIIKMSPDSAWGVTSMLTLKPDITAFGTDIYSAVQDNEYDYYSGTSMATPQISGYLTLLKQHMRTSGIEITDESLLRKYLMSSAVPLINPDNGIEYSPRVQGAGLVNIDNAYGLELLLWNEDSGETKIELAEIADTFELRFTAKNLTDSENSYSINTKALTDGYFYHEESGKYFTADYSELMKRTKITVIDNPSGVVTIPAGETIEIVIEVKLDETDINKSQRAFINGFFVDGFVYLKNVDSECTVSIPYMGFYGDWAEIPVYIEGYYETLPFTVTPSLGMSWEYEVEFANEISALGMRDTIINDMEIRDSNGKKLDGALEEIPNRLYNTKTITVNDNFRFLNSFFWDGIEKVNPKYVYPDGEYTMVLYYAVPFKPDIEKTLEIPFIIDTVIPEMMSYTVEDTVLKLEISDNRYMRAVMYDYELIMTDALPEVSVELDISAAIENGDEYVYVYLIDLAGNIKVDKIPV